MMILSKMALSMGLLIAAVLLTLYQVFRSKYRSVWFLFGFTLLLMTGRRMISLVSYFQDPEAFHVNLFPELIALMVSFSMLAAAIFIFRLTSSLDKANKGLRQGKVAADAANRAKSEFLASVSHEVRTPLNAIIGFSELLDLKLKKVKHDPSMSEYNQYVSESAQRLKLLLEDMLEVSKLSADRMALSETVFPLVQAIRSAVTELTFDTNGKGLNVDLQLASVQGQSIRADRYRLIQVVTNLLSNAIKFSPQGGAIGVVVELAQDSVMITVHDQGPGVRRQDRGIIFEPFRQRDSFVSKAEVGSGLGLYICRGLARLHEGDVTVGDSPFGGAAFTLTLPQDRLVAADQCQDDWPDQQRATG